MTPTRRTALKLLTCLVAMPLSLLLVGLTQFGWFFLGFIAALPLSILYWINPGQALRDATDRRPRIRRLGLVMGLPQAMFGLLCAAAGVVIIGWVLYNTFVERQPEYSGGLLAFGIGPSLVLFGTGWALSAFRRSENEL